MSRTIYFNGTQITVFKTSMNWIARLTNKSPTWKIGKTEAEAVGKLIISLSS